MSAVTSSADAHELMGKALRESRSSAFSTQDLLNRLDQFVVECNEIIPGVVQALAAGDMNRIGALIDRSQYGAERMLGNQVEETIGLAQLARELGAGAASAFGAGFGGSVWALVKTEHAQSFKSKWAQRYWSRFPEPAKRSEFFLTGAGPPMSEFSPVS
jgi:galactokinase